MRALTGLRSIALLEASKGLLVLLTALAIFRYIHSDWQVVAERIVSHFHLNPAHTYPKILLALSRDITEPRLLTLASGALFYVALRWIEAYGLWYGRKWASLLGIISAGLYVPLELAEMVSRPSWLNTGLLVINLAIVAVLWRNLRHHRH